MKLSLAIMTLLLSWLLLAAAGSTSMSVEDLNESVKKSKQDTERPVKSFGNVVIVNTSKFDPKNPEPTALEVIFFHRGT
jgi:hypothetical protein